MHNLINCSPHVYLSQQKEKRYSSPSAILSNYIWADPGISLLHSHGRLNALDSQITYEQ